jgi:hypothetical protein
LSGARQLIFLHFFEAGLVAAPAGSAAARWGLDAVEEIAAATSAVVEEPADIGTLSWYRAAMGAAAARLRTQASLWSDTPARDAAQRHDAAEGVRSSGPDGSSWLLLPDQGPDSEAIALLRASVDRISTHGR